MSQREWADKDFYKVLGVSKTATKDEIKKAYRKLAQKYHPDANEGDPAAEQRFKEISEAHAILSNEEKRREYDQLRAFVEAGGERVYGFQPGEGGGVRINIGDLGDLFGGGGAGGGAFDDLLGGFGFRQRPQRGQDLETQVDLSFEDAVAGATVTINGAKVRIPPGVKDGARIKVAGKGGPAPDGGQPGDLFVVTHVAPHEFFRQKGNGDLEITVPVTFTEAALGTQLTVPTLDGSVTVKVPAGTRNGKRLRVRGRGAPRGKSGRGDLFVVIEVEVPQKLTKEEKELLEQFAQVHKGNPREHLDRTVVRDRKAS
ncbi:MAG: molecular chaperone DnaJ [Actinomycetota bacterium]|jgi:molecular chaperone DnaJ|nr:molecular chaperone DnaJ [Actinomycetota bacterium]MEA2487580.1 molecular chaperone DnaJ [Actinomycetota bacterium]